MMKLALLAVAALTMAVTVASSDQTPKDKYPWLVRFRGLDMIPSTRSRAFSALGNNFPANAISYDSRIYPEIDISYFLNKNLALEAAFALPQDTHISLLGVGKVGKVTHWSPMIALQYHYPIPKSGMTPYVGVGLNYVHIIKTSLSVGGVAFSENKDNFGYSFGVGIDYKIDERWSLNFDYKHLWMETNVRLKATGTIVTNLQSRPNLYSIGIGYRF